jgi:glycine betaine/proline transport system substrate-binding protein
MRSFRRNARVLTVGLIAAGLLAGCGSDDEGADDTAAGASVAPEGSTPASTGGNVVLAVNPWTGSAVNAHVAKIVMESQLGTTVELVEIAETATWPAMDTGEIDAVLEVWPSGHAADYSTYIDGKQSVVDLGKLGPTAKIGWYVPTFVVDEHPELATWEGFKDPELAKLFATPETGDNGQFLMGDPTYVTYDEEIISNLELPLTYVVGGSETTLLAAIDTAFADHTPVLLQFWQPHWKLLEVDMTEVELPEFTEACEASAAAADGLYACDYPTDELYKAASAGLEAKNATAYEFLQAFELTTEQQSEIAGYVDRDGMSPAEAADKWVTANPDVVTGWLA